MKKNILLALISLCLLGDARKMKLSLIIGEQYLYFSQLKIDR